MMQGPIQKQALSLPFGGSVDNKTDPNQVSPGNFLSLNNVIFTKQGLLQKRNGFGTQLPSLPSNASITTLTTFGGNLTAVGTSLYALSQASGQWINKGYFQPVQLSIQETARTAYSITQEDTAVNSSNIACVVFTDGDGFLKYQIVDNTTGQVLVVVSNLPSTATNGRAFVLDPYFIITFEATVIGAPHLQYISIPQTNLTNPSSPTDIATTLSSITTGGYDGYVANNTLFLAWDSTDTGHSVKLASLSSHLVVSSSVVAITGHQATLVSVTVDETQSTPVVWVTGYYNPNAYSAAFTTQLFPILSAVQTVSDLNLIALTSVAQNKVLTLFYDVSYAYSYESVDSDYVASITLTVGGTLGSNGVVVRSVGLASKAFLYNTIPYFLAAYQGSYQPTYFLCNWYGTFPANVVAKIAYSNGNGYMTGQVLPSANLYEDQVYIGYLLKFLLTAVNKQQGVANVDGIYGQVGVNLATLNLSHGPLSTAEIGNNLLIAGGLLWAYDGSTLCEQNFNVWPDDITAVWSDTGGSMAAQPNSSTNTDAYYYQVTYEWTDAQGNLHRSAPSVPIPVTTTGSGTSGSVTLNIPNLRLTYKTGVRIVIYRWSVANEVYYQVTSVTSPIVSSIALDSTAYTDTLADASILGNEIIYTEGGVAEDIGPPACVALGLFDSRLMLLTAEDRNLIWYSKSVIESTPVEMSDLFTLYASPSIGSQGSTGPCTAFGAMDDKFVVFKENAIYYMNGEGPDNTGANSGFSPFYFITATVGCTAIDSVTFIPMGLAFQSDKGLWLLGRDLSTNYFGAQVEDYNSYTVVSATTIPATNQCRFVLQDGPVLMFDYYFNKWSVFTGVNYEGGTLYQNLQTLLTEQGLVFQESTGLYQDGSSPVLISFTTAWMALSGLQGFQRAFYYQLLGEWLSPHILNMYITYNFESGPSQSVSFDPINSSLLYGQDPYYGGQSPYGGPGSAEKVRVFFNRQKINSFQITLNEQYDPSQGIPPGAGFTLSGLNLVYGYKKRSRNQPAITSVG